MKLTSILLIIIVFLQVKPLPPDKTFTYIKKQAELIQIIKKLRKQLGVSVFWNEKLVNVNKKMDADFKKAGLKLY